MLRPPTIEPLAESGKQTVSEPWAAFFDQLGVASDPSFGSVGAFYPFPAGLSDPGKAFARADGSAVSRKDNPGLFSLYGTTFGAGDGSMTFNLPNAADAGGVRWYVRLG